MRHVHCRWLAAAAISLVAFAPAQAQYPNKPVRLILPFPPGGAVDREIISRLEAESSACGSNEE